MQYQQSQWLEASAGPIVAGLLFGVAGYWAAWSGAVVFLAVDIVLRLLMIEKPKSDVNNAFNP